MKLLKYILLFIFSLLLNKNVSATEIGIVEKNAILTNFTSTSKNTNLTKLSNDLANAPPAFKNKILNNTELIEAWEVLVDAGVDNLIRKNIDEVEFVDDFIKNTPNITKAQISTDINSQGYNAWKLAQGAGSVFKAGDNIAGKVVVQVKEGTNGKIAVIGRKMEGHVNDVTAELAMQGKQVEAFNDVYQSSKTFIIDGSSYTWDDIINDFNSLKQQYGTIPDNILENSLLFKANQNWANKLISDGYEIIDIGYPQGVTSESIFYNMEIQTIFP